MLSLRCCFLFVFFLSSLLSASVIHVPSGADLQAAINAAKPGDTITLEPGQTYTGNFHLIRKSGTGYLAITTSQPTDLPPDGQRIAPSFASKLPKIVTPNGSPAISVDSYANHYLLKGIEITTHGVGVAEALISVTGAPAGPAFDIVLEQLYIHGDATSGSTRGIALNSASTTIRDCYISDIKSAGAVSQAIAGWDGPGPFTIENNYIESSGQNIVFGEMPPRRAGTVPSGISIQRNTLAKPVSAHGVAWKYSSLVQLSNAEGVTILRNTFESGPATEAFAFFIGGGQVENASVRDVVFRRTWCGVAGGRYLYRAGSRSQPRS